MSEFKVVSDYSPSGDQPKAIDELSSSILQGNKYNTLLMRNPFEISLIRCRNLIQ